MITWRTEERKLDELKTWDKNPRTITARDLEKLKNRISDRGFHGVIKIDSDNTVLSGNQSLVALKELGYTQITCMVPERALTEAERDMVGLESNLHDGRWDYPTLLKFDQPIIMGAGFEKDDIRQIYDDHKSIVEDDVERVIRELGPVKIQAGELWKLGRHMLYCGDSTKPGEVDILMGDVMADMVYCDPPYNIGLNYSKGMGTSEKYGGSYDNDSQTRTGYGGFLLATLKNAAAHAKNDAHFFYWCDERYIGTVQGIYEDCGIENRRVCLWIKNNQNPTPQVAFNKTYEPCVYGTRGRPWLNPSLENLHEVINRDSPTGHDLHDFIRDIWLVPRDATQDYEHPTQKPLTLHERPLKRCTQPTGVVMDLFGGSGSTLMACEQLGRTAYLLEQDPRFCQVIKDRWERATGLKAELV